ncbi:anti-sigma factor family protein [Marininema halotolerans]|uniref:Anti-sigma-W factor RsiW n=1 Tax=Marininema halotolerans TaxID=1155944 RepID=A0A1I6SFQ7_9BACL|nr:zf-HC2 domain-containing protein [Marininema halotolerans]SFS75650.1 Putative zinc-finger [Marininema halotolerans]
MHNHCQRDQLMAYHFGELSSQEEQTFHHHLSQCPSCQEMLQEMEGLRGTWDFPDHDIPEPDSFTNQVMDSLPKKAPTKISIIPFWRKKSAIIHSLSALAATFVIFFSNGFYWVNHTWFRFSTIMGTVGTDHHNLFPLLQQQVGKLFS